MKISYDYILQTVLPTLCCGHPYPVGTKLGIYYQKSKNRVMVQEEGSINLHYVKLSSLRRCSDKTKEPKELFKSEII